MQTSHTPTEPIIISSGADHEKVGRMNPHWDEFDWCRYWELDARKGYRKADIPYPGGRGDCGDPRCKCKALPRVNDYGD